MTVSWRARAPWIVAILALLIGAVLVVLGAPADTSASFGWFVYQPLAAQAFFPQGGVSLSLTSLAGLVLGAVGVIALAFLTGRWVQRRRGAMQPSARRRIRSAWWGVAAVTVVGAFLAFSGWPAPQPLFTVDDSYIAFADGWSPTSTDGLLLDGFVLAPGALFGIPLILGGLALAAFLLGLSGARRRARLSAAGHA